MIEFIDADIDDDKPFFAFAAYTSPHWPLQVPEEYLNHYAGEYEQGYDKLREENFEALIRAGIIPAESQLPPRNDAITPWQHLSESDQKKEARKMQLYAAMVENLDDNIGRLIRHLEHRGIKDNTLVVFMSDNGAAGGDFYNGTLPRYEQYVRANYDNSRLEEFGRAETWVSYGAQWAEAGSAPFSYHKSYASQGGIVAPMFASGPGVTKVGAKSSTYLTVMDLAPTFLEIAGAEYPTDGSVKPMLGESISPVLAGTSDRVHSDDYVTTLFHRGHALIRQGRWKLTALERSFDEDNFALFDVVSDPGEVEDLSDEAPKQREHMLQLWRRERVKHGITLPEDL